MSEEYRNVPDREALAIGVRVQLSWVRHAPYTQRADLSIDDRLATVVDKTDEAWLVRDDSEVQHRLEVDSLEVAEADPSVGRWRIEGAIPTFTKGDRLLLRWRHRSEAVAPVPPREDCYAIVVDESPEVVTARLDEGSEILLHRFGAQAEVFDRRAPRWFVVGRG